MNADLSTLGEDIQLKIHTLPLGPLDEFPGQIPKLVTVREIDFRPVDNTLEIYFSRSALNVNIPAGKDIKDIIGDWTESSWAYGPYKGGDWRNGKHNDQDEKVSPLSLMCNDLRYVVYFLSEKSWEFSRPQVDYYIPFSTGKNGQPYFFREKNSYFYKKAGYFICDGKAAVNAKYPFCHGLNIHVDLIYDNGARMPLIIDPDIRHPGGSGEP